MAIAIRSGEQAFQVQMVCLDDAGPRDDVLRRIERLVSWTMVRETARPFYSDLGRPGVDPVVLVKVFLVAAVRGIDSMRETLRVAEVDLRGPSVFGVRVDRTATASRDVQLRAVRAVRVLLGVRAVVQPGPRVVS